MCRDIFKEIDTDNNKAVTIDEFRRFILYYDEEGAAWRYCNHHIKQLYDYRASCVCPSVFLLALHSPGTLARDSSIAELTGLLPVSASHRTYAGHFLGA